MHRELPRPASCAPVRETQEIEGISLGVHPSRLIVGTTPKFHQAGLLRMKRQTVLREPLRQYLKNTFRVLLELKAQQAIIGMADLVRFPA